MPKVLQAMPSVYLRIQTLLYYWVTKSRLSQKRVIPRGFLGRAPLLNGSSAARRPIRPPGGQAQQSPSAVSDSHSPSLFSTSVSVYLSLSGFVFALSLYTYICLSLPLSARCRPTRAAPATHASHWTKMALRSRSLVVARPRRGHEAASRLRRAGRPRPAPALGRRPDTAPAAQTSADSLLSSDAIQESDWRRLLTTKSAKCAVLVLQV